MPSRDKDQKTAGIQDVAIFPSRLARLEKSFMQKWQKKKNDIVGSARQSVKLP